MTERRKAVRRRNLANLTLPASLEQVKIHKISIFKRSIVSRIKKLTGVEFSTSTLDMGYGDHDLLAHIDAQMMAGMHWDNHKKWRITLVKSVADFVAGGYVDLHDVFHRSNVSLEWVFGCSPTKAELMRSNSLLQTIKAA